MAGQIIDIGDRFGRFARDGSLRHPCGAVLPMDAASFSLLMPRTRAEFTSGDHRASVLACALELLRPQDRVLEVGSGLGVVSAALMATGLPERVIAIEPDPRLASLSLKLLCASNAPSVEVVNAVATASLFGGQAQVLLRGDPFESSLSPLDGPWDTEAATPLVSLGLILAEVRIEMLIIDERQFGALACSEDLFSVDRVVVLKAANGCRPALDAELNGRGFHLDHARGEGDVVCYRRLPAKEAAA